MVRRRAKVRPVRPGTLPKPVIFHDGRLVKKPTPLIALIYVLYFPMGVVLSTLRIFTGFKIPIPLCHLYSILTGWKITIKGIPPAAGKGTLYVLNHRTIYDAIIVSTCLRRMTTVVSYSISKLSETLSPTEVVRLTRDRTKDAKLIKQILIQGKELLVCPEGTTCREQYLLRFSSLFAELTDQIVPVAIDVKPSWFYGTTARGNKWLDPFFFAMNPRPSYEVTFLNKLSPEQTCMAGKSSYEVANNVQQMIAGTLGFKCTNLTRMDKYRALAGTDGFVH